MLLLCTMCPMEEKLRKKTYETMRCAIARYLRRSGSGDLPPTRGTWGTGQPSWFRGVSEHRCRRESRFDEKVVVQQPFLHYAHCSRSQVFTISGSNRIRWRNLIVGIPAYRKLRIWRTLHPTYRARSSAVQREQDGGCAVVSDCGAAGNVEFMQGLRCQPTTHNNSLNIRHSRIAYAM